MKITLAILVGLGLMVGAYLYVSEPRSFVVENTLVVDDFLETVVENTDFDQDGLKDWEETLWGSDAKKADSDGDGVSDGDEVAQGRNPALAGPDDLITGSFTDDGKRIGISETDSVAERFITEYFLLREKRGGSLSQSDEIALVEGLLKEITVPVTTEAFSQDDFTSLVENTPQNIRMYGNTLGKSIVDNSPENLENELIIFAEAFEDSDEEVLTKLDPIIEGYAGVQKTLTTMDVPLGAQTLHMDLANTVASLRSSIRAMRNVFTDPVGGVAGVEQYQKDVEDFKRVLNHIEDYFYENNVTFGENEHGSILVQTI